MASTLAQLIASAVGARSNCIAETANGGKSHLVEWIDKHRDRADDLAREHLPSGSGFDNGTRIDWTNSTSERLVFTTSFHHMNDGGFYDGWTDHIVTVRASLVGGLDTRVSGKDRNGIKDYIADCFDNALRVEFGPEV